MKRAMIVVMFVLAVAGLALAQNWSSTVDVLGAHQNQGRGCAGCHAPHSGAFGGGRITRLSAVTLPPEWLPIGGEIGPLHAASASNTARRMTRRYQIAEARVA